MTIQSNDDAAWLSLFRQRMDEMFSYMFRMKVPGCGQHEFTPYIDIYESLNQYVIQIDLPGLSESDFNVTVIGSALRIEGIKRQDKSDAAVSYICLERHFGRFSLNIEIPVIFDPGILQKTFEKGVLSIKIGKKQ